MLIDLLPQSLEVTDSCGYRAVHFTVNESIDNDEALAYLLSINPALAEQKDANGHLASDYAISIDCKILLAWYQRRLGDNETSKELQEFLYAVVNNTLLSHKTAKKLAPFFKPYWPEGLKDLILLSASPKTAQSILKPVRSRNGQ